MAYCPLSMQQDAASLRCTSKCWAHTARRGLSKKNCSMFSHIGVDETNSPSMIPYKLDILQILPSSDWNALIEGFEKWPEMAQQIKETEFYLPDKDVNKFRDIILRTERRNAAILAKLAKPSKTPKNRICGTATPKSKI